MKNTVLIILLFRFFFLEASTNLFEEANNSYSNKKYENAIAIYDSILTSEKMESAELYYNMGNCYYKIKDWPNAILHYEKSLKIKKSKYAHYNLGISKLNIIDKIESLPEIFYKKWWNNLINLQTTKSWQILSLICIWISIIFYITCKY